MGETREAVCVTPSELRTMARFVGVDMERAFRLSELLRFFGERATPEEG